MPTQTNVLCLMTPNRIHEFNNITIYSLFSTTSVCTLTYHVDEKRHKMNISIELMTCVVHETMYLCICFAARFPQLPRNFRMHQTKSVVQWATMNQVIPLEYDSCINGWIGIYYFHFARFHLQAIFDSNFRYLPDILFTKYSPNC